MNKNSLEIIHIHMTSEPGGIEKKIAHFINENSPLYNFVYVIRQPIQKKLNVYANTDQSKIKYGKSGWLAYISFFKFCFNNKRKIMHVHNIGPLFLFIAKLAGVSKLVYSIHGTVYFKYNPLYNKILKILWKLSFKKSYKLTSNSFYSKKIFENKIAKKTVEVLYNPFDLTTYFKEKSIKEKAEVIKVAYVGRVAEGKNLSLWLEIAEYILSKSNSFVFEIYGDGPIKNEIINKIKHSQYQESITMKGYVNNTRKVYNDIDVLLFLSKYESFGNVMVESILCGTPVICSSIPSAQEIFNESPEFLVDLNNPNLKEEVYRKLNKLSELQLLSDQLIPQFQNKFGLENHIKKLGAIYNTFEK